MLILNIIFYVIAVFLITASLVVILAKNPMTSVLALVFTFICASFLFVLLRAEFIAMIMLIIYVGAIAVLFLFIIMLLKIQKSENRNIITKNFLFGLFLGIAIFVEIVLLLNKNFQSLPLLGVMHLKNDLYNSYNLGLFLYNHYYTLIIVTGILLTVVVIGIVYICYDNNDENIHTQNMGKQVMRKPKDSIKLIKTENEKGIDL